MKYIFLSNLTDPAKDKYGPVRMFHESPQEALRRQQEWLQGKVLLRPKATPTYSVEQLESMGMIGVYMPIEDWGMSRAKYRDIGVSTTDNDPKEGVTEDGRAFTVATDALDRGLNAAFRRTNKEVANILARAAVRMWMETA